MSSYLCKLFDNPEKALYYAPMTPEQVIRHYGGERQAADALLCTRQIVNHWKRTGVIPRKTQAWIHLRTNGVLKAASGK